jgi:hypothetical protein
MRLTGHERLRVVWLRSCFETKGWNDGFAVFVYLTGCVAPLPRTLLHKDTLLHCFDVSESGGKVSESGGKVSVT